MSVANISSHGAVNKIKGPEKPLNIDVPFVKSPTDTSHFSPASPTVNGVNVLYNGELVFQKGRSFPPEGDQESRQVNPSNKC